MLWRVKYQMWQCQLRIWTSSIVVKSLVSYLIRLGLTPAYGTYSCSYEFISNAGVLGVINWMILKVDNKSHES